MASNFSEELYLGINTAVNVGLFFAVVLPILLLCLLCILGLIYAEGFNHNIRVILINVLAPVMCVWLAVLVLLLGYPARVNGGDFSCRVYYSIGIAATMQEFSAFALYAVAVFIFVKYGAQMLKWYWIILCLVLSWVTSFAIGLVPYCRAYGVSETSGFCYLKELTELFKGYVTFLTVGVAVLSVIIAVFSALSYFHIRKNALGENAEMKKAFVKYLLCLNIAAVLTFIGTIIPISYTSIRAAFEGEKELLGLTLVKCIRVFIKLPSVIVPVAAIIILKPIGLALNQGYKKCTHSKTDEGYKKCMEDRRVMAQIRSESLK